MARGGWRAARGRAPAAACPHAAGLSAATTHTAAQPPLAAVGLAAADVMPTGAEAASSTASTERGDDARVQAWRVRGEPCSQACTRRLVSTCNENRDPEPCAAAKRGP